MTGATWPDAVIAAVVAVPAWIGAIAALRNGRRLRTPSGGSLGDVVERTHDAAHANGAGVVELLRREHSRERLR